MDLNTSLPLRVLTPYEEDPLQSPDDATPCLSIGKDMQELLFDKIPEDLCKGIDYLLNFSDLYLIDLSGELLDFSGSIAAWDDWASQSLSDCSKDTGEIVPSTSFVSDASEVFVSSEPVNVILAEDIISINSSDVGTEQYIWPSDLNDQMGLDYNFAPGFRMTQHQAFFEYFLPGASKKINDIFSGSFASLYLKKPSVCWPVFMSKRE